MASDARTAVRQWLYRMRHDTGREAQKLCWMQRSISGAIEFGLDERTAQSLLASVSNLRRGSAAHAPAEHLPILLGGNQPRERADSRQHLRGRHPGEHRRCGIRAGQLSRRGRARVRVPRKGGRADAGHAALLLERSARSDAGRDRSSGFFYHFLDVATGRRAWQCELSTIDTAILVAGALTAAAYFDRATDDEREVRSLPTRCTGAWTGDGRRTARRPSPTAGSRKPGSCDIAGRDTTRR